MVGALGSLAATALGSEEIVVVAPLVDIGAFHQVTCHLHGFAAGLHGKTVSRKLNNKDSGLASHLGVSPVPETSPVEVFTAVGVFEIVGID